MNYRFCPPGTEKDPSRPFTTCKTTTHAKNRSCCFAVDRFDADAPSGIARRGVTMPVREMTKIVEHGVLDHATHGRSSIAGPEAHKGGPAG